MNDEHHGGAIPDPHGGVATFTYDACGPVPRGPVRTNYTTWHSGTGTTGGLVPSLTAGPNGPPGAAAPCLRHCCEFRLCGTESKEQTIALDGIGSTGLIAAIERVRAFFTREGASGAPASAIGGVEVHAELRGGALVCAVQLSDFTSQDLVVVQVDLAVYRIGGTG
jgi:hypothetical protein